ncbi:MAG TPA: dihydroorotase [Syntrophobacteraceae bacterium]|nr:dihydroorotase [Syntrophobacteraceae bacterium]
MNFILRQGRLIDSAQALDQVVDLVVQDGLVAAVEPRLAPDCERFKEFEVFDIAGKWVVPGLIDMHVHLREPGEEYKETIASGTRAAVAGGFTAVACMPNTQPVNDCAAVTEFIRKRAEAEGFSRVYPVAAISKGLAGEILSEFGELREAGAVAVSDDGRPVMNSQLMRRALEYARIFDLVVISHAEDLQLSHGGLMNEGAVSTRHGLLGIPSAAEEIMVARDLLLAEFTRGRLHLAHVSTAGSVRMIRDAKQRGIHVTAETAPHYFTLTEDDVVGFSPLFKMNPPLRRSTDRDAIRAGLADGTIDAIATDHAPHSTLEKDTEFNLAANGIIGLESALPLVLELVRESVLTPLQAIAKMSWNPARILGVPGGTLRPGVTADITVIDPAEEYTLNCETFHSKSRNCPFHGREVHGRVSMTVVGGTIVSP